MGCSDPLLGTSVFRFHVNLPGMRSTVYKQQLGWCPFFPLSLLLSFSLSLSLSLFLLLSFSLFLFPSFFCCFSLSLFLAVSLVGMPHLLPAHCSDCYDGVRFTRSMHTSRVMSRASKIVDPPFGPHFYTENLEPPEHFFGLLLVNL